MKCGGYSGEKIYDLCLFLYMVLNLEDIFCASLLTKEGSRVSYPECIGKLCECVSIWLLGYLLVGVF